MKHLDSFSKRVLVTGIVTIGIFLSAGFLMLSVNRLHASGNTAPAPSFFGNSSEGSGKYAVSISHAYDNGVRSYYVMLLNTETGVSKGYVFDYNSSEWAPFGRQIPQANF